MKRKVFSSATIAGLLALSAPVLANNFVVGQSSNGNVTLNDANNWDVIRSASVTVPAGDGAAHGCVATASADMAHAGAEGLVSQYRFVLARNDANPVTNGGSERILELVNNAGVNDANSEPVSTTLRFTNIRNNNGLNGSGTHTF
ncbi:MAG: hypothetical protein GEU82_03875 [Luteitalea sp.]|nr:hypothetical protein [Luteitalea sp.]